MPNPDLSNARWRKSTRSSGGSANCVEIAELSKEHAVRDSKNLGGPALIFSRAAFGAFLDDVTSDEVNR